jgi:hypothetical protein
MSENSGREMRRIIFGVSNFGIRRQLITTIRQLDKLNIDYALADHSVSLAKFDAEDSTQFNAIVAILTGVGMVYVGWWLGNDVGLSLVGAISGGVCAVIVTMENMRRFDRRKLKRIARLQEDIKSRLECAEELGSRSEIFTAEEASTGAEERSIPETQTVVMD